MGTSIEPENIARRIYLIRGRRVMLDSDLAAIYGVPTKILNRAVKRNPGRFPEDFMFRLEHREAAQMRCQIGTASRRNVRNPPTAFTEHGAIMLASVLNSPLAVQASVQVVRAFVRLRELLEANKRVSRRLRRLGSASATHSGQIHKLFEAVDALRNPPNPPRKTIGFHP